MTDNFWLFMVAGYVVLLLYGYVSVKAATITAIKTPNAIKGFVWGAVVSVPLVVAATVTTTFAGFGPGAMLYLASLFVTPLLGWRFIRAKSYFTSSTNDIPQRWRVLSAFVSLILALSPFTAQWGIVRNCDRFHTQQLQPIIADIEQYKEKQGIYPHSLNEVAFSSNAPDLACFWDSRAHYKIEKCEGITVLMLDNLTGGYVLRYDFGSQTWKTIDRLDGTCSFLEQQRPSQYAPRWKSTVGTVRSRIMASSVSDHRSI